MDFSGQYLTINEYKMLGGTLDLMPFNLLEFEARKKIDLRTQGRLKKLEEVPEEVKLCMYNLVEQIKNYINGKDINKNISSETIDGYSVTYATAGEIKEIIKSKNYEINETIITYLSELIVDNQRVIFAGVE